MRLASHSWLCDWEVSIRGAYKHYSWYNQNVEHLIDELEEFTLADAEGADHGDGKSDNDDRFV